MQMPEMDGVTLATKIRAQRSAQMLPLLLFSSLGRRDFSAHGEIFAAHLTKPLKASQLFDTLLSVFAAQRSDSPTVGPARVQGDAEQTQRLPLRILLAEDNTVNQKLALRLLEQMGYRADVAGNGLEVIEALARQPYDVVLLDVQMPEMDGLEAARRICARWPAHERPRLIAMTANAMQGDREVCLEAGMDDYISKPVRSGALSAALSKVVPLEKGE
jgi:CheY-like chemotaxis protein